jgi:hypothetical protein
MAKQAQSVRRGSRRKKGPGDLKTVLKAVRNLANHMALVQPVTFRLRKGVAFEAAQPIDGSDAPAACRDVTSEDVYNRLESVARSLEALIGPPSPGRRTGKKR